MRTCPKCGKIYTDQYLFCGNCGLRTIEKTENGEPCAQDSSNQIKKKSKAPVFMAVFMCMLIAMCGYLYYLYTDMKDSKDYWYGKSRTLSGELDEYKKKADFMDDYVVIVSTSGGDSTLYHKYGCSELDLDSFRVYNYKLAVAEGYEPCEKCIETY